MYMGSSRTGRMRQGRQECEGLPPSRHGVACSSMHIDWPAPCSSDNSQTLGGTAVRHLQGPPAGDAQGMIWEAEMNSGCSLPPARKWGEGHRCPPTRCAPQPSCGGQQWQEVGAPSLPGRSASDSPSGVARSHRQRSRLDDVKSCLRGVCRSSAPQQQVERVTGAGDAGARRR